MFLLATVNGFFGSLVRVIVVCGPGALRFLWRRDFLWLVPERICMSLGKIQQKLLGERLTDKIMLCKKRKNLRRSLLNNSMTKPLEIYHQTISKAPTTRTLSISLRFQKTDHAKQVLLPKVPNESLPL